MNLERQTIIITTAQLVIFIIFIITINQKYFWDIPVMK